MLTDHGPWLYTCLTFCGRFAAHREKPRPTVYAVATAAVVGLAVSLKGALPKISLAADGNASDLAVRNQKSIESSEL